MSKIRRGGYVFVTFIGDHAPRHVHVYEDSRFVVKYDLDHDEVMEGRMNRAVLKQIAKLREEGRL